MGAIKNSGFFRIVSIVLVTAFIAFDISWAYPPENGAHNSTLAVPGLLQQSPVNEQFARLQQSVFSQSALIASVYDAGEYFFGKYENSVSSLPWKYAKDAIIANLKKQLKDTGTNILNIVPVECIKKTVPEELKDALKKIGFTGDLPDEGVVFMLFEKGGKRFLVQVARRDKVSADRIPGYEWVISDKYLVKYMPEDYNASSLRATEGSEAISFSSVIANPPKSPSVIANPPKAGEAISSSITVTESPKATITNPIAQVEVPATKTGDTQVRSINIRAILFGKTYSIEPFSAMFGVAGMLAILSWLKDFSAEHPFISTAMVVGLTTVVLLRAWRTLFPVSWYLSREYKTEVEALIALEKVQVALIARGKHIGLKIERMPALIAGEEDDFPNTVYAPERFRIVPDGSGLDSVERSPIIEAYPYDAGPGLVSELYAFIQSKMPAAVPKIIIRIAKLIVVPAIAIAASYCFGGAYVDLYKNHFWKALCVTTIIGGITLGTGSFMEQTARGEPLNWSKIRRWSIVGAILLGPITYGLWYPFLNDYTNGNAMLFTILDLGVFAPVVFIPIEFLALKYFVSKSVSEPGIFKTMLSYVIISSLNIVWFAPIVYCGMTYFPNWIVLIDANAGIMWAGIAVYILETWKRLTARKEPVPPVNLPLDPGGLVGGDQVKNIIAEILTEIRTRGEIPFRELFVLVRSKVPASMKALQNALDELKPLSEKEVLFSDAISKAIAQAKEKYRLSDEETGILWLAMAGPGQGAGEEDATLAQSRRYLDELRRMGLLGKVRDLLVNILKDANAPAAHEEEVRVNFDKAIKTGQYDDIFLNSFPQLHSVLNKGIVSIIIYWVKDKFPELFSFYDEKKILLNIIPQDVPDFKGHAVVPDGVGRLSVADIGWNPERTGVGLVEIMIKPDGYPSDTVFALIHELLEPRKISQLVEKYPYIMARERLNDFRQLIKYNVTDWLINDEEIKYLSQIEDMAPGRVAERRETALKTEDVIKSHAEEISRIFRGDPPAELLRLVPKMPQFAVDEKKKEAPKASIVDPVKVSKFEIFIDKKFDVNASSGMSLRMISMRHNPDNLPDDAVEASLRKLGFELKGNSWYRMRKPVDQPIDPGGLGGSQVDTHSLSGVDGLIRSSLPNKLQIWNFAQALKFAEIWSDTEKIEKDLKDAINGKFIPSDTRGIVAAQGNVTAVIIGSPLPQRIIQNLEEAQGMLKETVPSEKMFFNNPDRLHISVEWKITDKPMDDEQQQSFAASAVEAVSKAGKPFDIHINGINLTPGGAIIAQCYVDTDVMLNLRDELIDELKIEKPLNITHITLGYITGPLTSAEYSALLNKIGGLRTKELGQFEANGVSIVFNFEKIFSREINKFIDIPFQGTPEAAKPAPSLDPVGLGDKPAATKLFDLVASALNGQRAKYIESSNKLISSLAQRADAVVVTNSEPKICRGLAAKPGEAEIRKNLGSYSAILNAEKSGWLDRFIPHWGELNKTRQWGPHKDTVAEHTLGDLEALNDNMLPKDFQNSEDVYIMTFFHDFGKKHLEPSFATSMDMHNIIGEKLVREILPELGMPEKEVEKFAWYVKHHDVMYRLAMEGGLRKNIKDETIQEFLARVTESEADTFTYFCLAELQDVFGKGNIPPSNVAKIELASRRLKDAIKNIRQAKGDDRASIIERSVKELASNAANGKAVPWVEPASYRSTADMLIQYRVRQSAGDVKTALGFLAGSDTLPESIDILLIVGSSNPEVPRETARLLRKLRDGGKKFPGVVLFSGKEARGAPTISILKRKLAGGEKYSNMTSEAEIFQSVFLSELRKLHFSDEDISKINILPPEIYSRDSGENMRMAKGILEKYLGEDKLSRRNIVVMQTPQILRRARATFEKEFGRQCYGYIYMPDVSAMSDSDLVSMARKVVDETDKLDLYGPGGKDYIVNVDVPAAVSAAVEKLRAIVKKPIVQDMTTVEIKQRVRSAIAAIEIMDKEGIAPKTQKAIESLKNNLTQFEADGGMTALIILARRAQDEGQKLIIGLETDWIPGINTAGSLQKNAISSLMSEIYSIGEAIQSMGLDNVMVVRSDAAGLANKLARTAKDTGTDMRNIVIMASKDAIESPSFKDFRDRPKDDKPFLTGINPEELNKLYDQFKDDKEFSNQLHIELAAMLYMTLEIASGKEPPEAKWIKYDSVARILILIPGAEIMDCEKLGKAYKAEIAALQAA